MIPSATDPDSGLRPAQREHLIGLLDQITDPQIKAAVEAIFLRGLHDFNDLRMVFVADGHTFREQVLSQLATIRREIGHLDGGLTVMEQLTSIITERELLPEIRALRDDVAGLVRTIGALPDGDDRPLIARQIGAERGIAQLQSRVAWVAPIAAVALLLAAVALALILVGPSAIIALAGW